MKYIPQCHTDDDPTWFQVKHQAISWTNKEKDHIYICALDSDELLVDGKSDCLLKNTFCELVLP